MWMTAAWGLAFPRASVNSLGRYSGLGVIPNGSIFYWEDLDLL